MNPSRDPAVGGHVDVDLLERYADGVLPDAAAWSVEAHVTACGPCRALLDTAVVGIDDARLDGVWAEVLAEVRHRQRRPLERFLVRVGVPERDARLLSATRSLTASWLLGVSVVLAVGVATAWLAPREGASGLLGFLLLAPLVPLAGVAVAYGPRVDPTYELGVVAPMSTARLLLMRTLAVVAASMVLATVATLALPVVGWTSAAWLAPSLALTAAMLAASTRWSPRAVATVLAVGWVTMVGGVELQASSGLVVFGSVGQAASMAVLAASTVVLVAARDRIDPAGRT